MLTSADAGPRLTVGDLAGATHVRDHKGWHPVRRVDATSVTVSTPYSGDASILIERIVQRHPALEEASRG